MADPLKSEGARLERKAVRGYLNRKLKAYGSEDLLKALSWVLKRQDRYDKKPGGL